MKLPRVSIFENTRIDKLNIVLVVVLYSNLLDCVWRVVSSQRVFFFLLVRGGLDTPVRLLTRDHTLTSDKRGKFTN